MSWSQVRKSGSRLPWRTLALVAGASAAMPGLAPQQPALRLAASASRAAGTIGTYAGGGVGDHGPATEAMLMTGGDSFMGKIAVTATGDLLICDNARLRRVHNGVITTIAGTGDPGSSGDGGPAALAEIMPNGVAVGPDGKIYVSDDGSPSLSGSGPTGSVRMIDSTGVVTTLAGNLYNPKGLTVDRSGNVYVAESALNRVVRIAASGGVPMPVAGTGTHGYNGDGIPAVAAELDSPYDVAVDSAGNVYIADTYNNRIRKVDTAGMISTVLPRPSLAPEYTSSDSSVLNYPLAVAIDHRGKLYVGDSGPQENRPRVLIVDSTVYYTFVAFPDTETAYTTFVTGIAFDPDGDIDVDMSDGAVSRRVYQGVHKVPIAGTALGMDVYDGRLARDAYLPPDPKGGESIAIDTSGRVVVTTTNLVRRVGTSMTVSTIAGNVGGQTNGEPYNGESALVPLIQPISTAVDGNGDVYFGDLPIPNDYTARPRVLMVDAHGLLHAIAGAQGVVHDGENVPAIGALLSDPNVLLVAPDDDLYIGDSGIGAVRRVSHGIITTVAGPPQSATPSPLNPLGCDAPGNWANSVGPQGDGGPATSACWFSPAGLALDQSGNLYISDATHDRVRRVDTHGIITTVAGDGVSAFAGDGGAATGASLKGPAGLALDAAGDLFIADSGNHVIREVDHRTGDISTVVGDAVAGERMTQNATTNLPPPPRGDGGPALSAYLSDPTSIAFDSQGDLFIADPGDARVREVFGLAAMHGATASASPHGAAGLAACAAAVDRAAEDAHVLSPHVEEQQVMVRRGAVRSACSTDAAPPPQHGRIPRVTS